MYHDGGAAFQKSEVAALSSRKECGDKNNSGGDKNNSDLNYLRKLGLSVGYSCDEVEEGLLLLNDSVKSADYLHILQNIKEDKDRAGTAAPARVGSNSPATNIVSDAVVIPDSTEMDSDHDDDVVFNSEHFKTPLKPVKIKGKVGGLSSKDYQAVPDSVKHVILDGLSHEDVSEADLFESGAREINVKCSAASHFSSKKHPHPHHHHTSSGDASTMKTAYASSLLEVLETDGGAAFQKSEVAALSSRKECGDKNNSGGDKNNSDLNYLRKLGLSVGYSCDEVEEGLLLLNDSVKPADYLHILQNIKEDKDRAGTAAPAQVGSNSPATNIVSDAVVIPDSTEMDSDHDDDVVFISEHFKTPLKPVKTKGKVGGLSSKDYQAVPDSVKRVILDCLSHEDISEADLFESGARGINVKCSAASHFSSKNHRHPHHHHTSSGDVSTTKIAYTSSLLGGLETDGGAAFQKSEVAALSSRKECGDKNNSGGDKNNSDLNYLRKLGLSVGYSCDEVEEGLLLLNDSVKSADYLHILQNIKEDKDRAGTAALARVGSNSPASNIVSDAVVIPDSTEMDSDHDDDVFFISEHFKTPLKPVKTKGKVGGLSSTDYQAMPNSVKRVILDCLSHEDVSEADLFELGAREINVKCSAASHFSSKKHPHPHHHHTSSGDASTMKTAYASSLLEVLETDGGAAFQKSEVAALSSRKECGDKNNSGGDKNNSDLNYLRKLGLSVGYSCDEVEEGLLLLNDSVKAADYLHILQNIKEDKDRAGTAALARVGSNSPATNIVSDAVVIPDSTEMDSDHDDDVVFNSEHFKTPLKPVKTKGKVGGLSSKEKKDMSVHQKELRDLYKKQQQSTTGNKSKGKRDKKVPQHQDQGSAVGQAKRPKSPLGVRRKQVDSSVVPL
ncbi:uncharacterized protein LOC121389377 [Gigantopelta aegis]|uniref:uncharacterized protein LOC121389377 n=1 Tax=Gigantopelta aegis TaxID=1735272 RepID=UPI001B888458|nr:uncharacterized protein LOC121389377 [Gigantopelta aegis]